MSSPITPVVRHVATACIRRTHCRSCAAAGGGGSATMKQSTLLTAPRARVSHHARVLSRHMHSRSRSDIPRLSSSLPPRSSSPPSPVRSPSSAWSPSSHRFCCAPPSASASFFSTSATARGSTPITRAEELQVDGEHFMKEGRHEDAAAVFQACLDLCDDSMKTGVQLKLAYALLSLGRFVESGELYQAGIDSLRTQDGGKSDERIAEALLQQSEMLFLSGRLDEALSVVDEALPLVGEFYGVDSEHVSFATANKGMVLCALDRASDALPLFMQSLEAFEKRLGATNRYTEMAHGNCLKVAYAVKDYDTLAKLREGKWGSSAALEAPFPVPNSIDGAELVQGGVTDGSGESGCRAFDPNGVFKTASLFKAQEDQFVSLWKERGLPLDADYADYVPKE
eukprot:TRINITY_DN5474_c0_g2_i1.p1 TRINITY_DN5474_c0_g2~~TRINITY_DN5474_c0_g2_i1.p1  ORF type:complete len:408 (-),score=71.75 TRINITY_DN5474_c0_g2_i1:73-1263(-)